MNKAYVEQIRNGLSTTALSMDTQWAMMHNPKLNDQQRLSSEACYQGLMPDSLLHWRRLGTRPARQAPRLPCRYVQQGK